MVMIWNVLFLSLLVCYQPFVCAGKKKPSSRVVMRDDGILKEIDVAHESHEHGGHGDAGAHEHSGHAEQTPEVAPAKPEVATVVAPVVVTPVIAPKTTVPIIIPEKKDEVKSEKKIAKLEFPDQNISDIDRAKQQIQQAEVELAKLKQLVIAAQASPVVDDVKKIVALNKALVAVFDKQIKDYRAQGVSYADPRIKQAQQNIRIAEQELETYEKQLKSIKPVATSTSTVEPVKKKTAIKTEVIVEPSTQVVVPPGHAHMAAPEVIQETPSKPALVKKNEVHAHSAVPVQVKPATAAIAAQHEHAAPTAAKPIQHDHAAPIEAAHAHGNVGKQTTASEQANINQATPSAPPSHDHGAAPSDHAQHGAAASGADQASAAFMNLHAYHAQGLDSSKFKLTPFGYVQSEISFATRQLAVIQEFQPFLVPIHVSQDFHGVDIEDRSQFIPALHAHVGVLIEGPEVLHAKPSADISLEYYSPLPLNYAPATDPGLAVRIAGIVLIHASMFVEWEKTVLLFGQTWHPGEDPIVSIALDRVTFFGQLADPMNRLFQVRVTQKVTPKFNFIAAFTSNLDFKAAQNLGVEADQTQNPYWLNFHFQARAKIANNVFAVAADIYTEQPRLEETAELVLDRDPKVILYNTVFPLLPICPQPTKALSGGITVRPGDIFATKQGVTSFSMMAFTKIDRDPFVFKAKALVGSSLGHPLGGFGVIDQCTSPTPLLDTSPECIITGIDNQTGNECVTNVHQPCIESNNRYFEVIRGYGPLRIATFAAGFYLKNKIEPGIYIGFTKNLGSKDKIWSFKDLSPLHQEPTFEFSQINEGLSPEERLDLSLFRYVSDLDYTVVIAPRIKWTVAPVNFSAEIEYTKCAYGVINNFGKVVSSTPIDVIRFIFEANFNF